MADANQLLEQGTYNPTQGQKVWWCYYDRAVLAVATLAHALFTVPLGQGGKNLSDTNLTTGGEIPKGQRLKVTALEMFYLSDAAVTAANYQNIADSLRATTLEFWISGKSPQLQVNLAVLMGAAFPQHITGGAVGDQFTGKSVYTGLCDLPIPIVLAAKTNFRVDITHSVAVNASQADDEIYIALWGELTGLQ
jgi:hypothetical protein